METVSVPNAAAERLLEALQVRRERFAVTAAVFSRESFEEAVRQMVAQAARAEAALDDASEHALSTALAALACEDMAALATKTRTEYARLFLGPRTVVAPLHESAYLSGTPRMFTADTLAVRKCYEANGFVMKAKNREPEDAIGTELEFLRNLVDRLIGQIEGDGLTEANCLEVRRQLDVVRTFKEQHLDRWAPLFVERVADNDESGFYRAWARYLAAVLAEDETLQARCEDEVAIMTDSAAPSGALGDRG